MSAVKINQLPHVYHSWSNMFEDINYTGIINLMDPAIKKIKLRLPLKDHLGNVSTVEYEVYVSFLKSRVLDELLKIVDGIGTDEIKYITNTTRALWNNSIHNFREGEDMAMSAIERLVWLRTGGRR